MPISHSITPSRAKTLLPGIANEASELSLLTLIGQTQVFRPVLNQEHSIPNYREPQPRSLSSLTNEDRTQNPLPTVNC